MWPTLLGALMGTVYPMLDKRSAIAVRAASAKDRMERIERLAVQLPDRKVAE